MKGVHGKNGEVTEVPRGTRMWFELGGLLNLPLDSLVDWWINKWRGIYKNPDYWRMGKQLLREAMQGDNAEQDAENATDDEYIDVDKVDSIEIEGSFRWGVSDSNKTEHESHVKAGVDAENAMQSEEILETGKVTGKVVMEGESETGEQADTSILRKILLRSKRRLVTEYDRNNKEDKVESQTENKNHVQQDTSETAPKWRFPVAIPSHVTILPGEHRMYHCNLCQKAFKTKQHVKYHSFCDKSEANPKPFQCTICDRGFIAKSHYQYHLLIHKNQRSFKCIFCNKGFVQRNELNRHLRGHHGKRPHKCKECPRSFASNQALKYHVNNHNTTEIRNRSFECIYCRIACHLKFNRDQHLRMVLSGKRRYACNLCTKSFFAQRDLRRHLLTHTNEQPFQCRICEQRFNRKDHLQRHIRNKHGVSNEHVADQVAIVAVTSKRDDMCRCPCHIE